jgi:hypothetical protein
MGCAKFLLRQPDSTQNSGVGTTPTQMPREVFFDQTFIGIRALFQQCCDAHQDATDAIAALTCLFFHERLKHGLTHLVIHQALRGLNASSLACPQGCRTSILGLIIDQNSAGTTLPTTATKSNRLICGRGPQEMQDIPVGICQGRQARLVEVKGDHRQRVEIKT